MEDKELKKYSKQMQDIFDRASLPQAGLAAEIVETWTADQIASLVSTVWVTLVYRMVIPYDKSDLDFRLREISKAIIKYTPLGRDLAKSFNVKV